MKEGRPLANLGPGRADTDQAQSRGKRHQRQRQPVQGEVIVDAKARNPRGLLNGQPSAVAGDGKGPVGAEPQCQAQPELARHRQRGDHPRRAACAGEAGQ